MDLTRIARRVAEGSPRRVSSKLTSIALRIASIPPRFDAPLLPTLTGQHVSIPEVDQHYGVLPEEVKTGVKRALGMHDTIIEWAGKNLNQEALAAASGDPIKEFNVKKDGTMREVRNAVEIVKGAFPDSDFSKAEQLLDKLGQYRLPYESMEYVYGVYPYADSWVHLLHNLLSHLLYVAYDATVGAAA